VWKTCKLANLRLRAQIHATKPAAHANPCGVRNTPSHQSAPASVSPVRMRIACSRPKTKILPSPI
jgi:hypothetical protein